MNSLIIDIGNSNIVMALVSKNKIHKTWRILTQASALQTWIKKFPKSQKLEKILVSSVVPTINTGLKKELKILKAPIQILTHRNFPSLKLKVKNPSRIGIDRLVNAVAAQKLYSKTNLLIIDMGTATTLDVVTQEGNFLGGLITAGPHTVNQALFEKCSQLPLLPIRKTPRKIGKDTTSAIQSGIFYGYLSLIEGLIEKIESEFGHKLTIILTGGPAPLFKSSFQKHKTQHKPHLTLQGLLQIAG